MVVRGTRVGATCNSHAQIFARAIIFDCTGTVVFCFWICASCVLTSAIFISGRWVKIQGVHIRAPWNFICVANAVTVHVFGTIAAADTEGIELVSVAVAVSGGNVGTSALIDSAGSVADSASVIVSDTVVDVVADPVSVDVCCAVSSADAEGIELVSVAVAVSGRDVGAPALIDGAGSVADSAGIVVSDACLLYTSPSPRDGLLSRMPSSA